MTDASVRRRLVTSATYGLLGVAFALGVLWFLLPDEARWEPAVNSLTLIAGVTGIFVERLTAAAERRSEVLGAVADELAENQRLLETGFSTTRRRDVYPRLVVSAVDRAVVSGVLDTSRDTDLVRNLHRWRDEVFAVNRRLDLTEMLTFSATATEDDLVAFQQALHGERSYLAGTREQLAELRAQLEDKGVRAGSR